MRIIFSIFLTILSLTISTHLLGQSLSHVRTAQEGNATKFINQLQRVDTLSLSQFFSPSYYGKNSKLLPKFYELFQEDIKNLPPNTRRFSSLEFPKGLNLVKFRYIGEEGTILQVEISYEDGNINSKIVHLSLITTKSLVQERKTNRKAGYDFDH